MSEVSIIEPWELLQKRMLWKQLEFIHNKRILDFGSGEGITADHFAYDNEVVAVEPDKKSILRRHMDHSYKQINGGIDELKNFEDESFDVILCHNVLEYAAEREEILREFSRLLKSNGCLSILKHNRAGRVMQMVVLLNNFEHACELLNGMGGHAEKYGAINYYHNEDISKWSEAFEIQKVMGVRTFWDLQQDQAIHKDEAWQEQMLQMELKVSEIEEYRAVASFHHILLRKNKRY